MIADLLVNNQTDFLVLFLEGEELQGAKQNRVLNTSVLVENERITEWRATNCYTNWFADQRLNNQSNEAVNAMLQIATKNGVSIGGPSECYERKMNMFHVEH